MSLLFLIPFSLMVTNETVATTPPADPRVGIRYVSKNGPCTAIGPRLTCSVQHVGSHRPIFGDETHPDEIYEVVKLIEPPGSDVRFQVLDRDINVGYATLVTNYPNSSEQIWLVGKGAGGKTQDGKTYAWDGPATERLRWGWSDSVWIVYGEGLNYFSWRFDNGATASQDSGYAAFLKDGRYLGPMSNGENPSTLGEYHSAGKLAGAYRDWIIDYLPPLPPPTNAPPRPQVPMALTVTRQ